MSDQHIDVMALMPADTPAYMLPAWLGCISLAISDPSVVDAFKADTGNQWRPPSTGLEQMIDAATGSGKAFVEDFIRWANVNVWGPMDGGDHDGE